jgi:hypothetical protein
MRNHLLGARFSHGRTPRIGTNTRRDVTNYRSRLLVRAGGVIREVAWNKTQPLEGYEEGRSPLAKGVLALR